MQSGGSVHQFSFLDSILGSSRVSEIANGLLLVIILALLTRFLILPVVRLVLDAIDFQRLRDRKTVFLEMTPPSYSAKTPHATSQLFATIHGLNSKSSRKDRLLRRKRVISFEVVSTRSKGIRYIVQLLPADLVLFKQLVLSYLPEVQFRKVDDYLSGLKSDKKVHVMDFKQTGHFSYPLASQDTLSQHDPIAYLAGAMTKPLPEEVIAFQLVLSPASRRVANKVHNRLLGHASSETVETARAKLSETLFNVDIRTLVSGEVNERSQGLFNSLYLFNVPRLQSLKIRSNFPQSIKSNYRQLTFSKRLPALLTRSSNVLASSEIASLYHFPYGDNVKVENIAKNISKILPAPAELKKLADSSGFDVVLGMNHYHGSDTPIGLTERERERHVYIIGGTGNGKTTLMQYAMVQDIKAGKGIAVIDPHGDLAETILNHIPESRKNDVIYFNPRDISHPIGLNLLEQPEGLSPDELLLEQDFITEAVVSVFRKIFSDDDSGGHRIEHFLRNAIHTAFTVPDATIFTVYKLLTNTAFRRSVVSKLEDDDLKDFWAGEFNKAGDYQKVKMSSGVNAKLGRFQRSVVSRRILEQSKSTIDFDEIIQNKKILICNFSKGSIGEDTSTLLGISVLAKLQLAALKRSNIAEGQRTPFYLYVDEFQNFATTSFVQLLSEARKYKMFLTMAEQSTTQQSERRLVDIILANVGTVACFRSGSSVDEKLLLPLFEPQLVKGDIQNLSAYTFYLKISSNKVLQPLSATTILLG